MSTARHTDLPWVAVNDNPHSNEIWYIRRDRLEMGCNEVAMLTSGPDESEMDAKFIVEAANNHDALTARVAALEAALKAAQRLRNLGYLEAEAEFQGRQKSSDRYAKTIEDIHVQIDAALKGGE